MNYLETLYEVVALLKPSRCGRSQEFLDPEGRIRDISSLTADIDGKFLAAAVAWRWRPWTSPPCRWWPASHALVPIVGQIGKFICIGLNYADHAAESNMPIPQEPVVFNKWTSTLSAQ